jgi:hypothetical protein
MDERTLIVCYYIVFVLIVITALSVPMLLR